MKHQIILLSFLAFVSATFAQTPITIGAADVPIPGVFNITSLTAANPPAPTIGANQTWDYSAYTTTNVFTNDYQAETDTFFTNAGIDVYYDAFKVMSPTLGLGYNTSFEFDFNANGIEDKGLYVYGISNTLGSITGNNNDSLKIPTQKSLLSQPRKFMEFPVTANSAWASDSRRAVNFTITASVFGLNNAPAQHVYHYLRKDSVIGWGKLSVHTAGGSSIPYDVLQIQSENYALDSFYLAGAPAPAQLLNAFSVSQGQKTQIAYMRNFHRKGYFNYLVRFSYGEDNTYTNVASSFYHTDNLTTVGIEDEVAYSTLIFPNPANGNEIFFQMLGKNVLASQYSITDIQGKRIYEGNSEEMGAGNLKLYLPENIENGLYFIQIKDADNQTLTTEKIEIRR